VKSSRVIDADLQHPPEVVERLWAEIASGPTWRPAAGTSVEEEWAIGPAPPALSRGAQLLGLCVLPSVVGRVSDPMSGISWFAGAPSPARAQPARIQILIEVMAADGSAASPRSDTYFGERTAGREQVTSKVYVEYLRHLLRLRMAVLPARFLKFAAVGSPADSAGHAILWLLKGRWMALTLSKLVAAETAMASNFLWNDLWTFGDLASAKATEWRGCAASASSTPSRRRARAERRAARHAGRPLGNQPLRRNAVAIGVTTDGTSG